MSQKAIIEEFMLCERRMQQAKAEYTAAREALLALTDNTPGVVTTLDGGEYRAEVVYPAKKKWDTEKLRDLFGADTPPYVKTTLSIDEREYKRLPKQERDTLDAMYATVPGTPSIEIISNTP